MVSRRCCSIVAGSSTMPCEASASAEVLAAAREEGIADLAEVEAVVLETNGSFSVIHTGRPSQASTLRDVPGLE